MGLTPGFPDLQACPASTRFERHVRGSVLRPHLRWAEENRLPSEVAQLWRELPSDMAFELRSFVIASTWYPYSWLTALDRTLAEMFEGEAENLFAELGRYAARLDLSPIYRLLHSEGPQEFLRQHAIRFTHFYDFVTAVYRPGSRNDGLMVHRQSGAADEVFCNVMRGYYEQTLWSHGARRVVVDETECQSAGGMACSFQMQWR